MARQPRPQVPGGIYHLTTRGNRRQTIYLDARDRVGFLMIVASVTHQFGWLVRLYCLMDNHYHLLVETPEPNVSAAMHRLNSAYAATIGRAERPDFLRDEWVLSLFADDPERARRLCHEFVCEALPATV
jgi:putative transposase